MVMSQFTQLCYRTSVSRFDSAGILIALVVIEVAILYREILLSTLKLEIARRDTIRHILKCYDFDMSYNNMLSINTK